MAISTGNHPKALWPGVNAWWGAKYEEHPEEYTKIFDVFGSTQNYEEDVQHVGFGLAPVKPEGSSTVYDTQSQGYISRYTHVAYSLGYIVTREELADNLYEKVSMQRAGSLGFSMSQTRENVGANVLNRSETAAFTGGDGIVLYSTAHVNSTGGTYANILSTDADLSEASLEDTIILMGNATNDLGLKVSIRAKCLITAVEQQFEVTRILDSALRVDTANNDVNAIKAIGAIPEYAVNHYLTDTDAFYVITDVQDGLKWFDREAAEFSKDEDFDTDNAKAKGYMRFSAGWTDPRGVYGSPGA